MDEIGDLLHASFLALDCCLLILSLCLAVLTVLLVTLLSG